MKISVLQLVVAILFSGISLAHDSKAQEVLDQGVKLKVENEKLRTVLHAIERQVKAEFVYRSRAIQADRLVSIVASGQKLSELLPRMLSPLNIDYRVVEGQIILTPSADELEGRVDSGASSQLLLDSRVQVPVDRTISGTVADEDGEGLPGVSILVKGTQRGTTTNQGGSYTLTIPDGNQTLVFSFVGYEPQEVTAGNQTKIDISLVVDTKALNEVVVVGYGTVKKRDLTGSVASIGTAELKAQPINSFNQALQGRVAGVQVTQASNAPGGGITVRVRGGNSLSANNDPLYVIDGFPITNPAPASGAGNSTLYPNPLASINPNDIESIEVLKDASATAIYGSRGANGVVLVTTKRGKAGQSNVDFEMYYGIQKITKTLDLATAEQITAAKNEQLRNLGFAERYGDPKGRYPRTPAEYGRGTDWQDEIFRTAPIQSYQLAFSGGTEKLRYVISGNYFDQDGIIIASKFRRYTARVNLDAKVSSRIKVGTNINVTRSYNNGVNETGFNSLVGLATRISPASPVFDDNGEYQLLNVGPGSGFTNGANPVAIANTSTNLLVGNRVLGNIFADLTLAEGLTARISVGADIFNTRRNIFYTPQTLVASDQNGYGSNGSSDNLNLLNENILTYTKAFQDHAFDIVAGVTFQSNREERVYAEAQDFPNYTLGANNLGLANTPLPPRGSVQEWGLNSYLGRVNYRFRDRYLVTFTGRIDGSSRFGANNKYGFFPSGALAWRIKDEAFLKDVKAVSDMKLRVSYGITGNDGIGLYNSLSQYGTSRTVFGDEEVLFTQASRIANPDLRWEKTAQFDLGADIGLLDNRLQITADYYIKTTTDLLLGVQLPATTGFKTVTRNVGSLENRGVELAVSTVNLDGAFKWRTSGNISFNRNKVLALNNAEQFLTGSSIVKVGESVGSFYGNVFDGIWQTADEIKAAGNVARTGDLPGALRYKDLDGDGTFNVASDRQILGSGLPDFTYGLTNNFSYKNFDLSVFLQGVQGNVILNDTRTTMETGRVGNNLLKSSIINAWRPDRPSDTYPALRQWAPTATDSFYIEDGSFLRVKNVSLGYQIPLGTSFIRKARVYVSGQNLLTFTKYRGYDPEVNSDFNSNTQYGVDNYAYPAARTLTFGASLSF